MEVQMSKLTPPDT